MIWAWRIVLISFCLILAYASLSLRLGGVGPSDFIDTAPIEEPAWWQTSHPDTDIALSMKAMDAGDLDEAKALALRALSKNITNGNATAQLMLVYEKQGFPEEADKLAEIAEQLWPAHAAVRTKLAEYWLRRDNLPKLLEEWHVLMIHNATLRRSVYPVLQEVANTPDIAVLLKPYAKVPPNWWNGFFNFMAAKNENLDTIRMLYQARVDSEVPLSNSERRAYVRRLMKEKLWTEAYFAWLSGLDAKALLLSGTVFDGGFESNLKNTGFDWRFAKAKGMNIQLDQTIGAKGRRALRVSFNGRKRINFRHVSQFLNLTPGESYDLKFDYRVDRLETATAAGLSWRIRCHPNNKKIIAESDSIFKQSAWQTMITPFTVPTSDCPAQLLRLEASSRYTHEHSFKGTLWFDNISIVRAEPENTSNPKLNR
ncbi:MAG: hypothetical protein CR991_09285 [Proteobacteria bacterium]|nr:MAG: hypothetical protein CR991_09285 [Pseudomonadota bacterium]